MLIGSTLERRIGSARWSLLCEFFRFGLVGLSGAVVDTAVIYGTRAWLGLIGAGAVSYLVAATWTWQCNRVFTFANRRVGALHRQWLVFMGVNLVGLVFNRGAYFALVTWSVTCQAYPVLAVAAGAVAGMFWNFALSRRLVFR